jgi:hypothetical protein
VSFGKLLDEIAETPDLLRGSPEVIHRTASEDAALLESESAPVVTFANKFVAHLDQDHSSAGKTPISEFRRLIEIVGKVWHRWYVRVIDIGTTDLMSQPWSVAVRLRGRDLAVDRVHSLAYQLLTKLGATRTGGSPWS